LRSGVKKRLRSGVKKRLRSGVEKRFQNEEAIAKWGGELSVE
jgi:hypothetical protein